MSGAVFLVHHEAEIRAAARNALGPAAYRVHVYAELDAALANREAEPPGLVLLPWYTERAAQEALALLKPGGDANPTRVILLAPRDQIHVAILALDLGADDCVPVPFAAEELLARASACLRRPAARAIRERLVAGPLVIDKAAHRVTVNNVPIDLAPAEFRLLLFFLENQERVFNRAELLRSAWERSLEAGPRTVDVHVRRLRKLLEPFGCEDLIQTVRGFGYRFSVPKAAKLQGKPFPGAMRRPAV